MENISQPPYLTFCEYLQHCMWTTIDYQTFWNMLFCCIIQYVNIDIENDKSFYKFVQRVRSSMMVYTLHKD